MPKLPEKSRIQVIESTPERLALFIPTDKRSWPIGVLACFVFAWAAFRTQRFGFFGGFGGGFSLLTQFLWTVE